MSQESGYKQQKNLSAVQLLAEAPTFITTLLSALLSKTLFIYVDLLDCLGYMIRHTLVMLLSGKLTKDLRFEYNYGIGKIEAISSLLCDSIVLFGMVLTLGFSVYGIAYPSKPSDLLLGVAGMKLYDIFWDLAFLLKQRKILKLHHSAISETNYAAAFGATLFDVVTFVVLFAMWLLRNNPLGGYISPVSSILVTVYLMFGCVKRIRTALDELTDKTLPEEEQMKILKILTRHFDRYSQFHAIDSRKGGDVTRIDLHLSFEENTRVEDVINLQNQLQTEFDGQFGNSIVNIIMQDDEMRPKTMVDVSTS